MSSYTVTLCNDKAAATGGSQPAARHITTFARACLQRARRRSSLRHGLSLSVSAKRHARGQPKTPPGRLIALPALPRGVPALPRGVIVAGHVG